MTKALSEIKKIVSMQIVSCSGSEKALFEDISACYADINRHAIKPIHMDPFRCIVDQQILSETYALKASILLSVPQKMHLPSFSIH